MVSYSPVVLCAATMLCEYSFIMFSICPVASIPITVSMLYHSSS
ncbi:hypothetical protein [Methanosphaera stadtmanae]|nr:hypothetical protein [Methanosphaera stadtmanae]